MPHDPGGKANPKAQKRGHTAIFEPPPKPMPFTHLPLASFFLCPQLGGDDKCYLSPSISSTLPSPEPKLKIKQSGATLDGDERGEGGGLRKPGRYPYLRPQQPLLLMLGSTATFLWRGPAKEHPNRASPRLKKARKPNTRTQERGWYSLGEPYLSPF